MVDSVATHQICAKALARRFSKIVVDTNRRIIDYGDIITAGGFLSWVDLGLFLIEKILGPAIRAETARFVLDDPAAGEARYFSGFAPPQTHGDRSVLKAQEWVHIRDGRGVSLAALATAAGLERRTLLRRFASATGMTRSSIVGAFVLRERASSWREESFRRNRSLNLSAIRTWPHLHVYFVRL
jgi:transcriptional regulator GlxA family with amidase domain